METLNLSETTIKISDRVGFFGLWLFSFSVFLSTAAAVVGYVLFTFAMFFVDNHWRRWLGHPLVLASLGFGLCISLCTFFAAQNLPETSDEIWDKWLSWEKLLLFIPFGFWVYRRPEWREGVLLVSVLGLVVGMLIRVDWGNLAHFLNNREGFQFPAIGFAYVAGIALLGLGFLGTAAWKRGDAWFRLVWGFVLVVLTLILLQGFIQSYSRGSWLALLVTFFVLIPVFLSTWGKGSHSTGKIVMAGALFIALISVVGILNQDRIAKRLADESDLFEQILSNNIIPDENSSTALRLNAWAFGLDKTIERPWFGWGPGTTKYLVSQSGLPERLQADGKWLPHLHSAYIDMSVQFGLLGLAWASLILWLMGRTAVKNYQAGVMPKRYLLFFFAVFVFALVWSIFDYRTVHRDWRFSWILLAGTLFSFHLEMILGKSGAKREKADLE
jgi:O-antigen ligase